MLQTALSSLNDLIQLGVETLDNGIHPALASLRRFDVIQPRLNVPLAFRSFLARHDASSNLPDLYF
jgi:hypothetical protein